MAGSGPAASRLATRPPYEWPPTTDGGASGTARPAATRYASMAVSALRTGRSMAVASTPRARSPSIWGLHGGGVAGGSVGEDDAHDDRVAIPGEPMVPLDAGRPGPIGWCGHAPSRRRPPARLPVRRRGRRRQWRARPPGYPSERAHRGPGRALAPAPHVSRSRPPGCAWSDRLAGTRRGRWSAHGTCPTRPTPLPGPGSGVHPDRR